MNCKVDDNKTYPPEHLNLQRMNMVLRHRLRNLCCGMKMALERVSDQTRAEYPGVGDNCLVMASELDNLLTFTHRMDLLFDELPAPEPLDLFQLVSHSRQFLTENHPHCTVRMTGPEQELIIFQGSLVRIALQELLANAAELSVDDSVDLNWEYGKGLKFTIKNAFDNALSNIPIAPPEPFTTHRGRHDGLGLAIVQRIVDTIGGSFKLKQLPDNTVIVSIRIPASGVKGVED